MNKEAITTQTKKKGGSKQSARRLESNKKSIRHGAGAVNATKSEKIKATLKAKAEKFRSQTINVDENWSIVRLDELNWQIRHKDQRAPYNKWFFGTLRGALLALPDTAIGEEAKNAIADVSRCYGDLCEA